MPPPAVQPTRVVEDSLEPKRGIEKSVLNPPKATPPVP
jgi:hypothetical protein